MRRAGLLVGETLALLKDSIKVGMRTDALDAIAAANIKRGGGTSNFKGYHGFPATICISINDEIVHGIPGDRVIEDGDVVSIDCGAIIEGWHGDAAFSVGVGNVDPADQKMMDVCEESMWRGIAAGSLGAKLSDIGNAIESYTDAQGKYGILQEYGGHGIGTEMHQAPHVLNFGAVFLLALQEILRVLIGNQIHGLDLLIYGALLVFFIIRMPKGILGSWLERKT